MRDMLIRQLLAGQSAVSARRTVYALSANPPNATTAWAAAVAITAEIHSLRYRAMFASPMC